MGTEALIALCSTFSPVTPPVNARSHEARTALELGQLPALLPDFLAPQPPAAAFRRVPLPALDGCVFHHGLAWNPRLLRLNPHAARRRDFLIKTLAARMAELRVASRPAAAPCGSEPGPPP